MLLTQLDERQRIITEKGIVLTKAKYIEEKYKYEGQKIYTTKLTYVKVNIKKLITNELLRIEKEPYYKDAVKSIINSITEDEYINIQQLVNASIRKNKKHKVIVPDKEVEIDL